MTELDMMEHAKGMVRFVRDECLKEEGPDPEWDWAPVMFALDGEGQVSIIGFDPHFLQHKDKWRFAITHILQDGRYKEAVLVTSAYMAVIKKGEDESDEEWMRRGTETLPSEQPDKIECLTLFRVKSDGTEEVAMAEITRDGVNMPELGEFFNPEERWGDGKTAGLSGPTLQALRAGTH